MRAILKEDHNKTLQRRSTTEKPSKGPLISTYQRLLELDSKRRPSTDVRLKQIPILQQHSQQKLDFSHNLIRRIENLDLMKKLKILNLSHNRITTLEGIFNLRKLQEANLSHNCVQALPKEFSWLKKLHTLYLHNNKLAELESLDSISCLRLTKLTLENNYLCKATGFKKYIQLHFRWLEQFDRRPVSHRQHNRDYETPLESVNEDDGQGQLRTCDRNTFEIVRDHTATHKREQHKRDQSVSISPKPEATEMKIIIKTERNSKDSDILPYRQYLRRLNLKPKLIQTPPPVSSLQEKEQRIQITFLNQQFKPLIIEYRKIKAVSEKLLDQIKSPKSRIVGKLNDFINKLNSFFEIANSPTLNHQSLNKILKELNLINLEMLNLESQDKVGIELRNKIQEYTDVYCQAHRIYLSLSNKEDSSRATVQNPANANPTQLSWSPSIDSPTRQKQALKKILFSGSEVQPSSNRQQSGKQGSPLLESNTKQNKITELEQQLSQLMTKHEALKNTSQQERQQHTEYEQLMEEQLTLITSQKNSFKQKLQTVEVFTEANRKLYEEVLKNQQQVLRMMNQKLSGDFFQQIIVNQARTIQQLIKKNGQIEKYACELNPPMQSAVRGGKDNANLSKTRNTRNTRYPDSNKVINSAESNLLEYSDRQKPEQKNISEFTIAESAKFPEFFKIRDSVSFEHLGRQPTEYFRKSSGFSFKKSQKSLQSGSKCKVKHMVTEKNEDSSDMKGERVEYSQSKRRISAIQNQGSIPHHRSYFTQNNRQNTTHKSSSYTQIPLSQTENYRNYLKYYLRNNIIEVLSKGDVHPHLKGRLSKQQVMHRKYHSVGSKSGLISKKDNSSRKIERE